MKRSHGGHGAGGTHGGAEPQVGHVVPVRLLAAVLGVLLLLTVITVAATYVNLGKLNLWLALGIAVVKASIVALYFMHLRWDRPFNAIVFIGSITLVALFVGIALMDTTNYQPDLIPGYAPAITPPP